MVDSSRWLVVSGTSKTGRHSKKPKAVLCSAGSRQLLQVSDPTATAAAVVVALCSALPLSTLSTLHLTTSSQ